MPHVIRTEVALGECHGWLEAGGGRRAGGHLFFELNWTALWKEGARRERGGREGGREGRGGRKRRGNVREGERERKGEKDRRRGEGGREGGSLINDTNSSAQTPGATCL